MQGATPGYRYHLLRGALERFSRNLAQLDAGQLAEARRQADRTYDLESLVLAGPEAADALVPQERIERAFAEIRDRYADVAAFEADLGANGLSPEQLRQALYRELVFDSVMQRIAARHPTITQLDARLYYELNPDRFVTPERREARQILITINDAFADNTRDAALRRSEAIGQRLAADARRFGDEARQHSECPSAVDGGRLGSIRRGQLFPELDRVLFAMRTGEVSTPVETEVGFHLLLCESVLPGRRIPFGRAEPRIREFLERRAARNCQKAYLTKLREARRRDDDG